VRLLDLPEEEIIFLSKGEFIDVTVVYSMIVRMKECESLLFRASNWQVVLPRVYNPDNSTMTIVLDEVRLTSAVPTCFTAFTPFLI
jgi:hypothetical protein